MNLTSICIGLGAALGLLALARRSAPANPDAAVNAGLVLEFFALIGARAGYVLLHPQYFSAHPGEMAQFWLGGLSWIGCAAGLLLGTLAVTLIFKTSLAEAYARTVVLAMPLAALTWVGCWIGGIGYGPAASEASLFAWPTVDENGQTSPRLPLQILCAALLPLIFSLLEAVPARWQKLKIRSVGLAGILLSADLLLFARLRADPVGDAISTNADVAALLISMAATCLPDLNSGKNRAAV